MRDGVDDRAGVRRLFFPTLLACVAIMISRPEPRWLLIAF
jgi:hypothetical protein